MLHAPRHHPDIDGVGDREARGDPDRQDHPEERLRRPHRAHVATHHEKDHGGSHARHHAVHRDQLGQETAAHIVDIASPHDLAHEESLEDQQPKKEAADIFDHQFDPHRQSHTAHNDTHHDDPGSLTPAP